MLRPLAAVASLALATSPLDAQVGLASSARSVVLTATKHGTVSVALPGGSSATLPGGLGLGPNDFAPVAVETAWDLDPSQTSAVTLVAFFPVTGGPVAAGGAAAGTAGGRVVLLAQPITAGASTGTRTDQLQVRLDLTGWTSLPAGQYQGTLNLMAITQ